MATQTKISKLWDYLSGSRTEFSLEDRILNSAGVLSLTALLAFVFYDLSVIVSPLLAVITAITFLVQLFFYYRSRFRKQPKAARIAFTVGSYIFIALNFIYSSGIDGPTIFGLLLTFIVIITINDRRYHSALVIFHSLFALGLLWYNYNYPTVNAYHQLTDRYIDISATFLIILFLIFVIIRSVTGNYRREKNLADERATDLEKLHSEKNRLFSIVSHDLRSPLNSIQGYLEILSEHNLEREEREPIEKQLLGLTKSTSDMLHNLLAWSKTQLDGSSVSISSIHLAEAITPTLSLLQQIAERKDISLSYSIDQSISVNADTEMLQLVLRNLVYNSIKFTNANGYIQCTALVEGKECIISVEDNGAGIPAEKQSQVFTSKIKSSFGTNNEKGIGLGLLLCYDFTILQHGRIWFTSKEGQGSTFSIALPIAG